MRNDNQTKPSLAALKKDAVALSDPKRAESNKWFFKTGKGEYGYGDKFVGLTVPNVRKLAKKYRGMELEDVGKLLASPVHEYRLMAVIVLADRFGVSDEAGRREIATFYLANLDRVNNWDIVDSSAPHILGEWLADKDRKPLYALAKSKDMWKRRVAMISTFSFIRRGECEDALSIAEMLLGDKEDIMHKAAGWMLREVGKRCSERELKRFLDEYAPVMPRTMLRYSIEKFSKADRDHYMSLKLGRHE